MKNLFILIAILGLGLSSTAQINWAYTQQADVGEETSIQLETASEEALAGGVSEEHLGADYEGYFTISVEDLERGSDMFIGLIENAEPFDWMEMGFSFHLTDEGLSITYNGELVSEIEMEETVRELKINLSGSELSFFADGTPVYIQEGFNIEAKSYLAIISQGERNTLGVGAAVAQINVDPEPDPEPTIFLQTSPNMLKNYVHEKVYDNGQVIAEGRSYFDKLGRTVQSQTKNLETNHIIASETLYDEFGRPQISSLPFSTYSGNFDYKSGLLTFDDNLQAPTINSDNQGSLGWYYSENNTTDNYVPSSAYPYVQQTYRNDANSRLKSQSRPGLTHKIGSGKEEIYQLSSIVDKSELIEKAIPAFESKFVKTTHTDNEGNEVSVYTGKRMRITKNGSGNFCDAGVSVKIEYFDKRGRLLKMVPPEAYDCNFTYVDTENNSSGTATFSSMQSNTSTLIYTQTLSTYDKTTLDRSLSLNLDYAYPIRHNLPESTITSHQGPYGTITCYDDDGNIIPCPTTNSSGGNAANCGSVNIGTLNGNAITLNGLCPPDLSVLNTTTYNSSSNSNTTTLGPASPNINPSGLSELLYQEGAWGYRFTLSVVGTKVSDGSTLTLKEHTAKFWVNSTEYDGHKLYWVETPGLLYSARSMDDADNPFATASLSDLGIGEDDLDDYSSIKVYVKNFEEAQNFNNSNSFDGHTFSSVLSTSYPLNFLQNIAVYSEFNEKSETSAPINSLNCDLYVYNAKNQIVKSYTPDAGIVKYIYNGKGQLRFFQNAEQSTSGKFFYTHYDYLGRTVEQGEYTPPATGAKIVFALEDEVYTLSTGDQWVGTTANLDDGLTNSHCAQQSYFEYDQAATDLPASLSASMYDQKFTGGRLVKSWNAQRSVWYGYNIDGELTWTVQNLAHLGVKTLAYSYYNDGKLKEIAYQKENAAERLHHHYTYNNNGNLEKVATTTNGSANYTERVSYEYYAHGGLKREVIGKNLQGLDYVYTIQGQLKFINDPNLGTFDPGQDGLSGENSTIAPDHFGLALNYHDNDYIRSDRSHYKEAALSSRYDGLVASQAWNTKTGNNFLYESDVLSYQYTYDNNKQLKNATLGKAVVGANNFSTVTAINDFKVDIGYDKNGNITSLARNGNSSTGLSMDNLSYTYGTNTSGLKNSNRLLSVGDAVNNSTYADDFEGHTATTNYSYNGVGQLTDDVKEDKAYTYNAQGLISSVKNRTTNLTLFTYTYNEAGLKQSQLLHDPGGQAYQRIHYVYDAAGRVMAVHNESIDAQENSIFSLSEQPLYGQGRLGSISHTNAQEVYEIKDHLSNVRLLLKGAGNNGLYTLSDDFDDPYEQHLFSVETGFASLAYTNSRLEVNVLNTTQEWDGIYENINLSANTTYNLSVEYGEIIAGETVWLTVRNNSTNSTLFSGALTAGSNSFSFSSIAASQYSIHVYVEDQSGIGMQYWLDNFKLQQGLEIIAATDYYPFGSPLPGHQYTAASGDYKHAYQGEFSEQDANGYTNFQLRQFDSRLGRWLVPDPMNQYVSAYLGMGNNPISQYDPSGGLSVGDPGYMPETYHSPDAYSTDPAYNEQRNFALQGLGNGAYENINGLDGSYGSYGGGSSGGLGASWSNWGDYYQDAQFYLNGGIESPVFLQQINRLKNTPNKIEYLSGRYWTTRWYNTFEDWNGNQIGVIGFERTWHKVGTIKNDGPASGVAEDSWLRYIPILGSGLDSYDAFAKGNYWAGLGHAALAISDLFLVKALAVAASKIAAKTAFKTGSHVWKNTRSWLGRTGQAAKGQHVHHIYLHRNQGIGKYFPNWFKNQPWNLKAIGSLGKFSSATVHGAIHGKSKKLAFNFAQKLYFGGYLRAVPFITYTGGTIEKGFR